MNNASLRAFLLFSVVAALPACDFAGLLEPPDECERDSDCDSDEECHRGECEEEDDDDDDDDDDGGEGEIGEGEGELSTAGPSLSELQAACSHISTCLAVEPDETCASNAATTMDAARANPACLAYLEAADVAVDCLVSTPCDELTAPDSTACLQENDAAEQAMQSCPEANGGGGDP